MNNDFLVADIPAYITVHLGKAGEDAENVTVSFPDYIKSVASLQLSPNIPQDALYAIIYSQITLALNRINSRFYRAQRYSFDITNDNTFDQRYEYNYPVFENISRIVDKIFTQYIARGESIEPILARVCYSGERCAGLSVDGSIEMAQNGRNYLEILRSYYGRDVYIVEDARLSGIDNDLMLTYPLFQGQTGSYVNSLQIALNRISANYPTIPFIDNISGIYDEETSIAVSEFQRIFDIDISGVFDKQTYYRLLYVYDSVKMLNYLVEEGAALADISTELRGELSYGSVGNSVKLLQYYLLFVSVFDSRVPPLQVIGVFGENTYQSVVAFQKIFGFTPDGIVTEDVWNVLLQVYENLYSSLPDSAFSETAESYFGNILVLGSEGVEVRYLQEYLKTISEIYGVIPYVTVNGVYDEQTENAVRVFQQLFGIKDTGVVTSTTWNAISRLFNAIRAGETKKTV
ncbi:MAG: spore cortex-lytic protein [Ruminococcaceae bacterium]|nr:spore cortex-lytic protein [Oscillospiraceae bacterium]